MGTFSWPRTTAVPLSPPAGATNNGSLPEVPIFSFIRYGAIAAGPHGLVGRSWRYRTRASAEYAALNKCGATGCKVLSSFTRCGALARDGSRYQGGIGRTRKIAEDDAVTRLGGGLIVTWACNYPRS
ncbi:DUF4189 domain-containing protein [Mycobacterium intracellulare]|uniref:DUF4189 domain-containing protein n=1 Tax=Mycobacterium intracellulare TaxID=1767 RepID=UPI000930FBDB|nr:DUF4189 domain-containing protein [Mycobacterium intracellulare]ARV81670.1 hypothetical protein BWK49_10510 [Mycobacterium intracellulare subsp. chimaera]ASQ85682.1 hypothetical protein CE197_08515 [Mycobacterium intracellulare subsp. chimaera]QGK48187.1 DUF4189 domain-containing protein [Mycobacterium intracellulare subsp. chimaera]